MAGANPRSRRGIPRGVLGFALAAGAALLVAAPASAQFAPGSTGLGDEFFPNAGNGGYDVSHYDLHLRYRPDTGRLVARALIEATATQGLSAFNLDFRGPRVTTVSVDGGVAAFTRSGQELTVMQRS